MTLYESVPRHPTFMLHCLKSFFKHNAPIIPAEHLLLILLTVLLVLLPFCSRASDDTIEYGVSMPVPDGWAEVRRDEFPEFYEIMALESYLAYDDLARFFILEKEVPLLREKSFDAISTTITAVIFKPHNRKDSERLLRKMADTGGSPYAELNAGGRLFYPLIAMSHYWSAARQRHQGNAPVPGRMEQWFAEAGLGDREPLMMGIVAQEAGFEIGVWLQERNDYFSYGLIGPGAQCMTFASADMGKERIGLLFAAKSENAKEALASIAFAQEYIRKNGNMVSLEKTTSQPRQNTGMQMLYYAGLSWEEKKEYAKAADAFARNVSVADAFHLAVRKFGAVWGWGRCQLKLKRAAEVVEHFPAYLDECVAQLGPEHTLSVLLRIYLGIARQEQGQHSAALSDYEAARGYAAQTLGRFSPENIALDGLIAGVLTEQGRFAEGRALYKDALNAVTESQEPKHAWSYWLKLSRLEELAGNTSLASFYSWIGVGIIWYADRSSKLLAHPSPPEFWELEPLLPPKGGPEYIPVEVRSLYDRQNSAIDTPWNKARDLMKGPEAKLYSRYGDVAAALHKAGEFGTESEKERTRADFHNWLDEVEKTLR